METEQNTSESQAARQEKVLARQISRSAFKMGVSELRRDYENWRVERGNVSYEGGTFDLSAAGPSQGPVSLTAVGYYGEESHEISGRVKRETVVKGFYNAITTKDEMNFQVAGPGCGGSPCVSGIDAAGNGDRHGISLWESDDGSENEDDVCARFDGQVEGRGDGCDVVARDDDSNVDSKMDKLKKAIGGLDPSEKTVCDKDGGETCDLSGSDSGSGVYFVKGDLTIDGNAEWNGIVFVAEGGSVTINGGGNTENINGSLLMEGNTDFTMHGGNRVQYNSENILDLIGTVSVSREAIFVADRNGTYF